MCAAVFLVLCLTAGGDLPAPVEPHAGEGAPADDEETVEMPPPIPLGQKWKNGANHFWKDLVYLGTFPTRPTKRGGIRTGAFTGATLILIGVDDDVREWVLEHRNETTREWAERFDVLGDPETVYVSALATWGFGKLLHAERATETGRAMLETLVFSEMFGMTAKGLFTRVGPGGGNATDFFSGDGTSFPSGHTWRVFAVATVLAERHGKVAAWIAYPVASLAGLARIEQDIHWASDVLAGAALGHVIGKAVVRRRDERAGRAPKLTFAPMIDGRTETYGVMFKVSLGRS
ncbi:MAG: phosphatase PAP2 family protein [Acidobacteriota bacterium]|nr:phosphatase PAP2 family protein [Acidobacteriota bacterium]